MSSAAKLSFHERQPLRQVGIGAAVFTEGIRLPEGWFFQWTSDAGPVSIRYKNGNVTSGIVSTIPGAGISVILVHPGHDTYVQFQANVGVQALFFVTG